MLHREIETATAAFTISVAVWQPKLFLSFLLLFFIQQFSSWTFTLLFCSFFCCFCCCYYYFSTCLLFSICNSLLFLMTFFLFLSSFVFFFRRPPPPLSICRFYFNFIFFCNIIIHVMLFFYVVNFPFSWFFFRIKFVQMFATP